MDRVLAIAGLRLRLLARRSRGAAGVLNLAAQVLTFLFGGVLALGIAFGFAALTWHVTREGDETGIRVAFLVVFYTSSFFGLIMPVLTGTMTPGFDPAPFRVFPISRGRLYAVSLAAAAVGVEHLLYYPALAAVFVTGVVLPGADVVAGLAVFLLVTLFIVGWGNALTLFLASVMRSRRTREFVGIVALGLLMVVFLVPALLEDDSGTIDVASRPYLVSTVRLVARAAAVLPPTLAADAVVALHAGRIGEAGTAALGLLLWAVAGIVLGYRVLSRRVLGERGRVPRSRTPGGERAERSTAPRLLSWDHPVLGFVPREVRAVAAKEIRYLLRSVVGRFNLVMMPVLATMVVFILGRDVVAPVIGLLPDDALLFGMLLYATLFSNNFVNNAFGWDRDGIQAYFLSPVRPDRVLAGKNLAVWAYNGILLLLTLLAWSVFKGVPRPGTLLSAVLFYASCILAFTTVGNAVSVLFPVSRDISSMRSAPSQIGILLSLVSLVLIGALLGFVLVLPALLDAPALRPVSLLVLLLLLAAGYAATLPLAGRLMEARKEKLLEIARAAD